MTTVGAYALPELLPFVEKKEMENISSLHYAPVIQVSVEIRKADLSQYRAFGGLVPSCEHRNILGILYPSACFDGRSPKEGMLFFFFIGGVRKAELLEKSDEAIRALVKSDFHEMLNFTQQVDTDLIEIFRHQRTIPQYGKDSGERLAAVERLQKRYPRLLIAGNLKDGIGIADRIRQGVQLGMTI